MWLHGSGARPRLSYGPLVASFVRDGIAFFSYDLQQYVAEPTYRQEAVDLGLATDDQLKRNELPPEAQKYFTGLGMQPLTGTPAEAAEHIGKEAARWTAVIRSIGVTAD